MDLTLDRVWAKTDSFQSIYTHSALAGIVAQTLLEFMLVPGVRKKLCNALSCTQEELYDWLGYLASLHDIGKVEGQFQAQNPEMQRLMDACGHRRAYAFSTPVRHEKTTKECLRGHVWKFPKEVQRTAEFYASILEAHHQGKAGTCGETQNSFWNALQEELERKLRQQFLHTEEICFPPALEKSDHGTVGALLLGLIILADWIASSSYFSQAEEWFPTPGGTEKARKLAKNFLELSGLSWQAEDFGTTFSEVWPNLPRDSLRGLQQETEALFRETQERISLVLLEAPMGEGKTEAGIYAAVQMARQWEKGGFYIGLPTAATSNQMVGRVKAMMGLHKFFDPVRLLHSMAWMVNDAGDESWPRFDTEEERFAAGWLQPVRRGLLSTYAVGTVDQAMMSVLLVRYGVLRLLGLAQKALVIDELHAYDVYMSELLHRLLAWCKALEIPVVLLSATLPAEKKRQMLSVYTKEPLCSSYPAITAVTESGKALVRPIARTEQRQTARVVLCPILHQEREIARMAEELVAHGGCLCVLLNTVDQAQAVYRALRERNFDGELLLFHARFPAQRRNELEQRCTQLFGKEKSLRPRRAILVATQVVEQSLDVDFDLMMTAIAPIDLLLQRLGRIFRHKETVRPEHISLPTLYVLTPAVPGEYESDGFIYPVCLLEQSARLLSRRDMIRVPEDIPELVESGYDPAGAPPEELELWMNHLLEDQVKASQGATYLIQPPEKGYTPIKSPERTQFDDLESVSYLSAKTRLGEPTTRIALLRPERFAYFLQKATRKGGRKLLSNVTKAEGREILMQSVSVRSRLLHPDRQEILEGSGMLEGIEIYPSTLDRQGKLWYIEKHGVCLVSDPELGMIMIRKDGDTDERIV